MAAGFISPGWSGQTPHRAHPRRGARLLPDDGRNHRHALGTRQAAGLLQPRLRRACRRRPAPRHPRTAPDRPTGQDHFLRNAGQPAETLPRLGPHRRLRHRRRVETRRGTAAQPATRMEAPARRRPGMTSPLASISFPITSSRHEPSKDTTRRRQAWVKVPGGIQVCLHQ